MTYNHVIQVLQGISPARVRTQIATAATVLRLGPSLSEPVAMSRRHACLNFHMPIGCYCVIEFEKQLESDDLGAAIRLDAAMSRSRNVVGNLGEPLPVGRPCQGQLLQCVETTASVCAFFASNQLLALETAP